MSQTQVTLPHIVSAGLREYERFVHLDLFPLTVLFMCVLSSVLYYFIVLDYCVCYSLCYLTYWDENITVPGKYK